MGMMFWYGIEQLFMDTVIRDPNTRALTTTVYTATLLIFDIPGGMIADRFGRRRTLIVGSTLQVLGVLIMGVSHSLPPFLFGVVIFGIYWALCNGAAQAMMYDHLAENNRHQEYARQQGSTYAFGFIGAGIANVLSGFIAHFWGLRTSYLLSAIPAVIALLISISLRESRKAPVRAQRPAFTDYLKQLLKTFKRSRIALVYAVQIIIGLLVFMSICEFGQITLLSYGMSSIWLGIIWAIDAVVVALALHHAHRLQKWPARSVFAYMIVLGIFAVAVPNAVFGTIMFIATYAGTEVIHNISETEMQHSTESSMRATVLSSVTFVGNTVALAVIWLFNHVMHSSGIIYANQTTAVSMIVLFGLATYALVFFQKKKVV